MCVLVCSMQKNDSHTITYMDDLVISFSSAQVVLCTSGSNPESDNACPLHETCEAYVLSVIMIYSLQW